VRKLTCTLLSADVDGGRVRIRLKPLRGAEVSDWIAFEPRGEPVAVRSVGRFIRILRAGRIRVPDDPYALGADLPLAADLLNRCHGTRMRVHLKRRIERTLTVWTEYGVERMERIVDFEEVDAGLIVRRRGRNSALSIPRGSLIRYEASSSESNEIVAIESLAD
jgi:hypothetical protein